MNKKLFLKVKELCKDTGLSEKYLNAITEKMGGSIEDDSTDEAEIEETANRIADVAKESQSEATRWVNKKNQKKTEEEEREEDDENEDAPKRKKKGDSDDSVSEELKKLRQELDEMKAEKEKGSRAKLIADAMEKHKIPAKFRDRFAKSISDDEDVDVAVAQIKQDFITDGLLTEETEGKKRASEKQVDEAADDLLKSITAN